MNSKFTLWSKAIIIISIAFSTKSHVFSQIVSAPGGGSWSASTTWVGGIAPIATDSVVIQSSVLVNYSAICTGVYISPSGSLTNINNNNYSLTVNGGLTNDGVIENAGYNFYLDVAGDIHQNGTWSNDRVTFTNTGAQHVEATTPFAVTNLQSSAPGGTVYFDSDMTFMNTDINFGGGNISIAGGMTLNLNNGRTNNLNVTSSGFNLNGAGTFYMTNTSIDNANIQGLVSMGGGVEITQLLEIEGVLQNLNNNNYTIVVNNITNNGTIQNSINYSLTITAMGDVSNNGIWSNLQVNLSGTGFQDIHFTQPLSVSRFYRTETTGHPLAQSDLTFQNTEINLHSDTLEFQTGAKITCIGGMINFSAFTKQALPALVIEGSNNFYLNDFNLFAPASEMSGVVDISSGTNTITGTLTINDTLRNRPVNNFTLNIDGNLINNGLITNNNYYSLIINISGDVENHGTWNNSFTYMNGTGIQDMMFTTPFGSSNFISNKPSGYMTANTDLAFANCNIDLNYDSLQFETGSKLSMDNCLLNQAHILKSSLTAAPLQCEMTNNSYTRYSDFDADSIYVEGIFQVNSGPVEFYGSTVVTGTLQNYNTNTFLTSFFGTLINKGTIQNNTNYYLNINVSGDVYNYSTWTNYQVNMSGNGIQQFFTYSPVSMTNLTNTNLDSFFKAQTNLLFSGVNIDLNNDTIIFDQGSGLDISGGYLYRAKVINVAMSSKSNMPLVLNMDAGSYLRECEFVSDSMVFEGVVQVRNTPINFYSNVGNLGTFTNSSINSYSASVIGNFSNLGIVENQTYTFTFYISGDLHNGGTWTNGYTYMNGAGLQKISMTNTFNSLHLTKQNGNELMATSDLIFDNTTFDMNGANFTIADDKLISIKNGDIQNGNLLSNHFNLSMNNSWCGSVNIDNVTLYGNVWTYTNVAFTGDVTVEGTFENRNIYNSTVTVNGDIHNNGNISNNTYSFYLTVLGDIYNNGSWTNTYTMMDGVGDQYIYIQNSMGIQSQLRLDANFTGSSFNWYGPQGDLTLFPGDFSNANSLILYFQHTAADADAGQYYCQNNLAEISRSIYVNTAAVPSYQLDLTVLLEGPFNGSDMNTTLNSGDNLPLSQPYGVFPWLYPGNESIGIFPNANIVDWIDIELRDASSAAAADNSTTFKKMVAFVLNDGSVVGLDGISMPVFFGPLTNDLFVVIRHRNHLDVMSANALSEAGGIYSYNFTSGAGQAYGTNAEVNLGSGMFGMRSGDANADGMVDSNDRSLWEMASGTAIGYGLKDFNQDSQIDNQDKNEALLDNEGENVQFPQ